MLPLPLGQAIRHDGKDGILVRIHGTQSPDTCGCMSGVVYHGGSAEFDVVWDDGTQNLRLSEAIVRKCRTWEIVEGVVGSPEDIATAIRFADEKAGVRKVEADQATTKAAAKRETDIARFLAEHPTLKTHTARNLKGEAYSGHALGAMNLKAQLTALYPGIKFSVRSDSFAGGDSIDVSWTDGPTYDAVNALCSPYEEGSFDGMTDSYTYNADRAWTDTFGGAKYVHARRDFSDALNFSMATALCDKLGIPFTNYDQKPFNGDHDDLGTHVARCLHAVAVPAGCITVTGVEPTREGHGKSARYRTLFAAAAPADAVADRRSAPPAEKKGRAKAKGTASLSEKLTDIIAKVNARHTTPDGWEESDKVPRAEAVKTVESGKQESRKETATPLQVLRHHVSGAIARGEATPIVGVPVTPSASSPRRLPASAALMAALKKVPATMLGYLAKQACLPEGTSDGYHRSFTLWCQVEGRSETDWRPAWAAFVAASDTTRSRRGDEAEATPALAAAPVAAAVTALPVPEVKAPAAAPAAPAAPVAAEEDDDEPASVIAFPVAEISLVEMPPLVPMAEPAAPVVGLGWLRRMRPAGQ